MFNESPNLSTLIDVPLSHIPLIPLLSFEILVLLISPSTSTRVKSTERVEAIYTLLKDVALSQDMSGGSNAMKQMFTFSLRSARKGIVTGNPVLAEEATSIAICANFGSHSLALEGGEVRINLARKNHSTIRNDRQDSTCANVISFKGGATVDRAKP
ncbi:hypothetical protein F2Q69_00041287 [Brassica cretica]|uniref:Uncharacterized protein n=1 Tax=Brassica cretica TaxID=69181 RepID=A0A8S9NNH6_BRACR|nr:hypothetical protein F2Q69_00041287 [Brassica cretica]